MAPRYAELHCHSNFSFLDGASHPHDLVSRAAELGYEAIAVTDHDGFYGAPRFRIAAAESGVATVYGTEVGFPGRSLAKLITRHRDRHRVVSRTPPTKTGTGDCMTAPGAAASGTHRLHGSNHAAAPRTTSSCSLLIRGLARCRGW
jgi:hypothetical protein